VSFFPSVASESQLIYSILFADVQPICEQVSLVLKRKAPCQIDDDEDDAAVSAGEQSEYDAALIGAACDLVGSLASTLGADFAQLFPAFQTDMASYYVSFSQSLSHILE
jgi:hypothetical protein